MQRIESNALPHSTTSAIEDTHDDAIAFRRDAGSNSSGQETPKPQRSVLVSTFLPPSPTCVEIERKSTTTRIACESGRVASFDSFSFLPRRWTRGARTRSHSRLRVLSLNSRARGRESHTRKTTCTTSGNERTSEPAVGELDDDVPRLHLQSPLLHRYLTHFDRAPSLPLRDSISIVDALLQIRELRHNTLLGWRSDFLQARKSSETPAGHGTNRVCDVIIEWHDDRRPIGVRPASRVPG